MKKCPICKVVIVLGGLGALNWGLVALLDLNLVETLLGSVPVVAKAVYILIGIAGAILLVSLVKGCPCTDKK